MYSIHLVIKEDGDVVRDDLIIPGCRTESVANAFKDAIIELLIGASKYGREVAYKALDEVHEEGKER